MNFHFYFTLTASAFGPLSGGSQAGGTPPPMAGPAKTHRQNAAQQEAGQSKRRQFKEQACGRLLNQGVRLSLAVVER